MTRTEQQDETASGKHGDDLMSINWTLNMRRKCCRFFSSSKINYDNNKLSRKTQVKNVVNSERKVINLDEVYNQETCSKKLREQVSSTKERGFARRDVISDLDDLVSFMREHDNKDEEEEEDEGEVFDDKVEEVGRNRDVVLNDDKVGLQQAKLDLPKKKRNKIVEEGQIVPGKQVIACEEVAAAADENICKSDNFSLSASSSILSQLLNSSLNQLIEIDDGSSVGTTTATTTNVTCRRNNASNSSNRISATSCDTYPPSAGVSSQSKRDYLLFKHFPKHKTTTKTKTANFQTTTTRRDSYSRQAKRNEKIAKRQHLSRGSISMLDVRYGVTGSNENSFTLGGGFNNERRITLDELPSGQCEDKGDFVDETSIHDPHNGLLDNDDNRGRRCGFKNSSHYCHQSSNANFNNNHDETGVLDALKAADQQQFVTFDKQQHFKQQQQQHLSRNQIQIQSQTQTRKANNELNSRDLIQQRENFTFKREKQVNHQQRISPEEQTYKCLAQSKLSELELEKHCCHQEEEEQKQKFEMQTPKSQKCPPEARMLINGNENLPQIQNQNQSQNQAPTQTQIIQYDSLLSQTNQQPVEQKQPVAFSNATPFLAPQFSPDFQCCPFCLNGSNISMLEPDTNINIDFDNEHFAAGVTHNNNSNNSNNNLDNHLSRQTNQQASLSSTCSSTSFSSHNLQVTTDSASSGHDSPPQEQEQRNKVARVDCGSAMGLAPSSMLRNARAHVVSSPTAGCERGHKQQVVAARNCCQLCESFENNNSQANDQHQKLSNLNNNNIIKPHSQTEDLDQLLNNTYADIKQHFSSDKSPISYLSDLNNNNTLVLPLTQIQTKECCPQEAVNSNATSNDNANSLPGRPIFSLDPRTLISSQHQQLQSQQHQQAVDDAEEEEEDSDQVSMLEATANLARVVDSSNASSVISSSASSLDHHCSRLKSRNNLSIPMPLPRFTAREEEPIYDIPSLSIDNSPATIAISTENNSSLAATKSGSKYAALIMCKPIEEREIARSQQVTFVRCLSPDEKYPAVQETPPAISASATTTARHQETRSGTNLNLVIKTTKSANKVSERHHSEDNNEKFKTCKCRRCLHIPKVAPKEHVRKKLVGERMNLRKKINLEDSLSQLSRVAAYGSGDRLIDNYYKRRFGSTCCHSSHVAATLPSCCSTCCSQFDFSSGSTSTMNVSTTTSSTPSTIVYLRKRAHRRRRNLISEQSCNETATTTSSCCSTCCSTATFDDKHSLDTEESSVETVGSLTQEYLRRHRSMARVGRCNKAGRILHRSSGSRAVYSHNRHTSAVRRGRRRTKRKRSYHYLLPATTMTTTNTRKKRVQSSRHRSGKYRVSSSVVALDDVDADADGEQTSARLAKLIDQKQAVGEYDDQVNNLVAGQQQKGKRLLISKRHAKLKTSSSRPIYSRNEESLSDKIPLVSSKHNRKLQDRDGVHRGRDLSENSSLCSQLATNRHHLNQSRSKTITATATSSTTSATSTSTSNSISTADTATVAGNYTRLTDDIVGGRQVNEQQDDLDFFKRRLKSSRKQKASFEQASSGKHSRNNNDNKRHNYAAPSQRATNTTGDERKVPLSKQQALQRQHLAGTSGGRDRSVGQVRKQQVVVSGGGDESDSKAHKLNIARRATSSHRNGTLCSCQRKRLRQRQRPRLQQQQRKQQCEQDSRAKPSRRYLRQLEMKKDNHKSMRNLDASLLSPNRLQLVTKKASSSKQKKLIRLIRQQQQELERARFKQLESARRQGLLCKALLSSRINSPSNNNNNLLGAKDNYYYVGQQVEQGKENEDIKYKFSLDRMLKRMFSLRFKSSKTAAFPNTLTKSGRTKSSRVGSRSCRHHHRRHRKFNHCHRHRHYKYSDAESSVTMNQLRLMQKALIASNNYKKTQHRYLSNLQPNPEQEQDTHLNIMDRFLVKSPRQQQQHQADTTASNLRWQLAPKQCQCNHCVMVDYLLEAKRNKKQQ